MIRIIKNYTKIFKGIRLPWMLLFLVVALSVVRSHVEVEAISLTASIIDGTQNSIKTDELIRYIEFQLISGITIIAFTYISGLVLQKINLSVRLKVWDKMMHLPTSYYDSDDVNELVTRVTTDADNAGSYFQLIINIFTTFYAGIVAYQKLFSFQFKMGMASLLAIPVILAITAVYSTLSYKTGAKARTRLAEVMGYLAERVRSLRLIKSFYMEDEESCRADDLFQKQCKANIFLSYTSMIQLGGMELVGCLTIVISFVLGSSLVAAGELTVGRLIGFYTLCGLATARLGELSTGFGQFSQSAGVVQKIGSILEVPDEVEEGCEMDVADADICLKDVCFSYQTIPVLKELNCTIQKGKVTAIVGTNGAGKSTLFKLLERMYNPTEGSICFGEQDITQFKLSSWRKSFAIVSQEKPLLSGTVRENILYGVERQVSEEELIQVAKMANIYDFIMKTPGQFDAQVGPGGSNFSGGQQQCIAIARAMMRNPDYLLLDEATSNLDAKSEQDVTAALHNLMKGRTTILIAHNYSATVFADQVIVLMDGKMKACGTPEELLETDEYYRTFAKAGAGIAK
ncbi:MAG: ABC transporter ATP-binding protein [Coprococcus sp.]|nr:ABC transporter ATP-binding protein [Coprococcus sp.]